MSLSAEEKLSLIVEFGGHAANTGATAVQIALLSARISKLQSHFAQNKKDHHGRRGFLGLVAKRRRLLDYIKNRYPTEYAYLIQRLGLRR